MKVFEALGKGTGAFTQIPVPELEDDQVLARVVYCGICGTDYALYSGNNGFVREGRVTYPLRLGHEWSGVVEKVGAGVKNFKPGDRVIGDNAVTCGQCEFCKAGNYAKCKDLYSVGTIDPMWPGAFGEFMIIPERHLYHVDDHVSLLDAALVEPLSVAYGGIRKMNITNSSIVAVIGTGCIAMSAAALAKAKGAQQVYIIGRNSYKLEKAMELGITGAINIRECDPQERLLELTGGRLADFILECSGAPTSVEAAFRLAQQRATVALIAFYEEILKKIDINIMVMKELIVFGVMGEYGNAEAALKLMAQSDLNLNKCITSMIAYDQLPNALQQVDTSKLIKTMVKISDEQSRCVIEFPVQKN